MVLVALYAFAMQIYCVFSGYSDMAKGLAGCMGFNLMHNFRIPYLSLNPQMFWRRWHISLSTWLRDYLYVSLGGNRRGRMRTYINLFLTMLIGGLWHGAAWTFVMWGAYQGLTLIVHRAWQDLRVSTDKSPTAWPLKVIQWLFMIHLVCLGWLLFRADSMFQVWVFLKAAISDSSPSPRALGHLATIAFLCAPLWSVEWTQEKLNDLNAPLRLPSFPLAGLIALVVIMIVGLGNTGTQQFIYFQF
jgi:alginate O-acetyltransferase complex protein AlgI